MSERVWICVLIDIINSYIMIYDIVKVSNGQIGTFPNALKQRTVINILRKYHQFINDLNN